MTDKRNIGLGHISDARESRSRAHKLPQKKMKTKKRIGLKESQSPSYHNSYYCHKDFTTPKRRPRIRFNGSYSGDSPNETESPQDIIWDPNSPSQSLNGQGDSRVIEISEIVNRIAPKVEKTNEGDSVLQWIGASAIPCTPEVRQLRVRRISTRQSNVDVEDLRKLAKQFDINMTRQDKEKQQESTEKRNKVNKLQSDGTTKVERPTSLPVLSKQLTGCSSQARQEEEELQALFDGPTQHVSGRLSPPSVNCTPENTTESVAQADPRSSSAAIKNTPVDAPKATEFDDDWENDDLLNDSFVLEMTQNPAPQKWNTAESCSTKLNFVAKVNPSSSNGRNTVLQTPRSISKTSTFTKTLPKVTSNQSTFRLKPPASVQNPTTEKLLKTSPVNQVNQQTHSSQVTKQIELDGVTKDCGVSSQASSAQFDGVSEEDMKSLFDSEGIWNDEEDDDLLCKACDDVEKLSASQEQQRRCEENKKLAHDKSKMFASKAPSSSDTMGIDKMGQPQEPKNSPRVFARSNSVPSTSGSSGFKQGYGWLRTTKSSSSRLGSQSAQHDGHAQNNSSQVRSALGSKSGSVRIMDTTQTGGNASHHYTFKRHLSDSMTLTNKVFISSHATPKCTAAEIERKKQEAIARRRLRMEANQKNGAPR